MAFFERPTSPHIGRPDHLFAVRHDPGSVSTSRRSGQKWPTDRFDLVWVFDRTGRRTVFTQVPQRLLAGDEDEPAPFDDD